MNNRVLKDVMAKSYNDSTDNNNNKGCETKNHFNKKRRLNNNESATATCDNSNTNNNLFRPDTAAAAAGIVSPVVTQLSQPQESNDSNNNKNSNNNIDEGGEDETNIIFTECSALNIVHFPTQLYRMLDDVERLGNTGIISWSNDGLAFIVYQPKVFAETCMKNYFNQSKYKRYVSS
jgi:hypothetical protein